MMWHYGYGMGWVWLVVVLLVLATTVLAVVLVTRRGSRAGEIAPTTPHGAGAAARRVLDERYARGEIDTTEYRERRDALER